MIARPADGGCSVGQTDRARISVAAYVSSSNIVLDGSADVIVSAFQLCSQGCHEGFDVCCSTTHQSATFCGDMDEIRIVALQRDILCGAPPCAVGNAGHIVCQCLSIGMYLCRMTDGGQAEAYVFQFCADGRQCTEHAVHRQVC